MADAECRDDDPYLYDEMYDQSPPPGIRCFGCGVRAQCLTFALDHDFEGIWGGKTKKQRDRLNRKQRRAKCPDVDCASTQIKRGTHVDTCVSCGLSWPTTSTTN